MSTDREDLQRVLEDSFQRLETVTRQHRPQLRAREIGVVTQVGRGVAVVEGLHSVQSDELLRFPGGLLGLAFNLDEQEIGCVLLDESASLRTGAEARRTGRVLDVPVGEELLGRVIDPVGRPLDGKGPVDAPQRMPCEREAPPIMDRAAVTVPMQTGWKVIDALVPVGRGQRELILGDRQTGKTTIAVDTILNQRHGDVICVYCAVAQRGTSVARVVDDLRSHDALEHCVVVVGEANSTPGQQFIAPFAATTIGEYFMEQGRDVLVVYDDLTSHARAYRELSLLLRRPPGREAFPGDIFYLHSRLLERSTHLRDEAGGGSLTALPIVETEAQNVSAYIPTNLISITDGQIYLAPSLFHKGLLPAVDVGRSVSRVGGKTQLPAYRTVAGDLRLAYSQFEELEKFARFSSQLDEATRTTLERGRRVREVFKQSRHEPLAVPEQVALLIAVTQGVFDELPIERIGDAKIAVRRAVTGLLPELCQRIVHGEQLSRDELKSIRHVAEQAARELA